MNKLIDVAKAAAEVYGLDVLELLGPSQTRMVVEARHVGMWVTRRTTKFSLTEIAEFYGRRRRVVVRTIRLIEDRMEGGDEDLMAMTAAVRRELGGIGFEGGMPVRSHPQRAPKNPNAPRGSQHPRAKLTEDQARLFVKRVEEDGRPVRDMAWIYGISLSSAYKLLRAASWTHI